MLGIGLAHHRLGVQARERIDYVPMTERHEDLYALGGSGLDDLRRRAAVPDASFTPTELPIGRRIARALDGAASIVGDERSKARENLREAHRLHRLNDVDERE